MMPTAATDAPARIAGTCLRRFGASMVGPPPTTLSLVYGGKQAFSTDEIRPVSPRVPPSLRRKYFSAAAAAIS